MARQQEGEGRKKRREGKRRGFSACPPPGPAERSDAALALAVAARVVTTAASAVVWGCALAWVSACAWLSKSPERRQLLIGACLTSMASGASSAASAAATDATTTTTTTSPTTPATKATRLTRGALKKIADATSTDGEQALLQQYTEFQHGLPTPRVKRRRVGSSTSESTTENDQEQHQQHAVDTGTADQENQAPGANTLENTMAVVETPTKAAVAETPSKAVPPPSEDESKSDSGAVEGSAPIATVFTVAPTVAEIALAQEEKKLEGAPEGELFVVTVLSSSEITPADDVDAEITSVEEVLHVKATPVDATGDVKDENDLSWAKEYAALDSLRRLSIHHHEQLRTLMLATEYRVVTQLVCPAAMNLRSAMVRNALMCIRDIVVAMKQDSEQFYGNIVPVLLQRTANEKQFIRDLARDALMTCVETSPSEILLTELLRISTTEKNAQIVSTAGLYTQKCIGRMEKSKLKEFVLTTHGNFMEEMSAFLNCKVVECKAAARRTLQFLRRHIGDKEFTALAKAKLEGTAQFELLKASEEKKVALAKSGLPKLSMRERMMQMKKQQQTANGAGTAAATDDVVVMVPDAMTR